MATMDTRPAAFDPYQPYRRSLLAPERVRALSELRPQRAVADTAICWLWIFAAWTIVAVWPHWWTILIAIPIVGTQYYALLIVGHDAIHRRLFRDTRWNDRFADLFVFGPVAAITRINNRNHLGHHLNLSHPDDPDLHQFTCSNKHQWHLLLAYLLGFSSLWRSFKNVFLTSRAADKRAADKDDVPADPSKRYNFRDFALIAIWQLALIGGLTYFVAWWAWPVLWLVPLYGFAFLGDNFRAFAEHSQPYPDARADRHRLITFLSNPLERIFVAPLNMNYHAAHHLWPSIPYYNLPQADREIRTNPAAQDGLEWRGSYFAYLLRYFRLLPLEDCPPSAIAEQPS
jgi:fatty acid desaturase